MKYTVDTKNKTIELEVSSPVELRDLIADLETIQEGSGGLYEGYTVTITAPPVFSPYQPVIQPLDWQPNVPNHPWGPNIVYCSTNNNDNG